MAIRQAMRGRTVGRSGSSVGSGAFRVDPVAAPTNRPSRRQTTALLSTLVVVATAIGVASYTVRPETARTFDLVHGSVFLTDQSGPVGIDFASGRPTLRLIGADKQVGATRASDVSLVPVDDGTLMINKQSGQFNMVDDTGFVIKRSAGGVLLPARKDHTSASAVAADGGAEADVAGASYIVRTGTGGTDVLLVNQSTVEAASIGRRQVQPRALLSTPAQAVAGQNAVAGANGDLWLLLGGGTRAGSRHEIRQMSVPMRSDTGARLTNGLRGTVDGPAAIGTATTNVDGTGGTAVAVASGERIAYFPADGSTQRNLALRNVTGVTSVLPVSGGRGIIAFLVSGRIDGKQGWGVVTLAGDGTHLRGPIPIDDLAAAAQPAAPAWSEGNLFTIDTATGHRGAIYRISTGGRAALVAGAADYPIARSDGKKAENADFSDAYIVSRGSRVLVNSPSHTQAVALFTDGARGPLIIRKSSAVGVSVAGGAEALTRRNIDPSDERGTNPRGQRNKPTTGTQINNNVDCRNTVQKPRIPVLGEAAAPGSNSVALFWNYPTLGDLQACLPTTWIVRAHAVSGNGSATDVKQPIPSQIGGTLDGLSPDTTYTVTVTAYLHRQGAESSPIRITTAAVGPTAPSGLRVRADSSGNWVLDWNGCNGAPNCHPATDWRIVPAVCDGLGVSTPPTDFGVSADASARAQPEAIYRGGADLLGRGLRFQVQGIRDQQQGGDLSASSGCVYSWRTPDASALSVKASQPASPSADGTTSITASVAFTGSATAALGGVGGTLTYTLVSNGAVIDRVGPTSDTSVELDNIAAGRTYAVQVTASPPRHPEVVVPVQSVPVEPAIAPWPTVGVSADFAAGGAATTGTLTLSFDLGSSAARTEHYDLVNSLLVCGSTTYDLNREDVAVGDRLSYPDISRFTYSGNCNVTVQLRQNDDHSTSPPLFGAGLSGTTTHAVTIPPPGSTAVDANFSAQWGDDADRTITVSYNGTDPVQLTSGWTLTASNGTTPDCGSSSDQPSPSAVIDVAASCIEQGGTFTVSITYTYAGSSTPHFVIPVSGTAPAPIDPLLVHFTDVAWGGDATNPTVNVNYDGTENLTRLTAASWAETVSSAQYPNVVCGHDTKNPGFQVISVAVNLATACPPVTTTGEQAQYQVTIEFTDDYGQDQTYGPYDVPGEPPS